MNKVFLFSIVYIVGIVISAFAQILLKKAAVVKRKNILKEYLNCKTITAYTIFFLATLCSLLAYKYIPLSLGPILGMSEYLFVAIMSYVFLKEKISKQKLIGIGIILVGILVFSL